MGELKPLLIPEELREALAAEAASVGLLRFLGRKGGEPHARRGRTARRVQAKTLSAREKGRRAT